MSWVIIDSGQINTLWITTVQHPLTQCFHKKKKRLSPNGINKMDNSWKKKGNFGVETEHVQLILFFCFFKQERATNGGRSEENDGTIWKLHCLKKAKHQRGESLHCDCLVSSEVGKESDFCFSDVIIYLEEGCGASWGHSGGQGVVLDVP